MTGAIVAARVHSIRVILDGFICTAAAACLNSTQASALDHCVAGHQNAEQAHGALVDGLNKPAMLSLGLRQGKGSGAALAIHIFKGAIACHNGMATFNEARVSDG